MVQFSGVTRVFLSVLKKKYPKNIQYY